MSRRPSTGRRPANWQQLRLRGKNAHAAKAVLIFLAPCAVTLST
jgi:hypothetical protein